MKTLHLVFKTHVDVGFTDTAARVVDRYVSDYIPRALQTAAALRREGGADRLVWTLPAWMLFNALEQSAPEGRRAIEAGIEAGDLVWHALPFTLHSELLDPSLFRHGLTVSQRLDRRFGRTTIAAKMTDVPGHTKGIVPLLAEAGVELLHVGVNGASAMPDVPPVFRWTVEGREVLVVYQHGYGEDCRVPGLDDGLGFGHTHDNLGPQSPDELRRVFAEARARFPGTEVRASTLDAFAIALRRVRDTLPVVREEIGDSWIHGAGSDPGKLARYRALLRLRRSWIAQHPVAASDPEVVAFSDRLMLVPEHTWSLDHKTYLPEWHSYTPEQLALVRHTDAFAAVERSWEEQRAYVDAAIAALGPDRARQAAEALEAVLPTPATPWGTGRSWHQSDPDQDLDSGPFVMRFDRWGRVSSLRRKGGRREWAGPEGLFGLVYQSFGEDDYDRFWSRYIASGDRPEILVWASKDYRKPGLARHRQTGGSWRPTLEALWSRRTEDGTESVASLRMPEDAVAVGAPRSWTFCVRVQDAGPMQIEVLWTGKRATRLPEASWLCFTPALAAPAAWQLDKMGLWISPLDVVPRGGRHLHGVMSGARYAGPDGSMVLGTLDAALVAPGAPALLNFEQPLDLEGGLHFNLHNNVWGTNFPAWYDEDAKFRFNLSVEG